MVYPMDFQQTWNFGTLELPKKKMNQSRRILCTPSPVVQKVEPGLIEVNIRVWFFGMWVRYSNMRINELCDCRSKRIDTKLGVLCK